MAAKSADLVGEGVEETIALREAEGTTLFAKLLLTLVPADAT